MWTFSGSLSRGESLESSPDLGPQGAFLRMHLCVGHGNGCVGRSIDGGAAEGEGGGDRKGIGEGGGGLMVVEVGDHQERGSFP